MTPQVSVIVPVYNVAEPLGRCVRSLLAQSFRETEIILVDDGSTDESSTICDAFARDDERVVVIHQRNGGLSDARNTGLNIAAGELIAFLDGDDWAETNMLQEMVQAVRKVDADVVLAGCTVDVVDDMGSLLATRNVMPAPTLLGPQHPPPEVADDLINLIGYAWNKLYRRNVLEKAGASFEPGLSVVEDMVFNAEVLTRASTVAVVDGTYVHYVQRSRATLGTAFHPEFLALRLRAIRELGKVLMYWGVSHEAVERHMTRLRVVALRSLVRRTSAHPDWSLRRKAAHLSETRPQIDGLVVAAPLSQRLQLFALRRLPATVVVVVAAVRDRLTRGRSSNA